jgi:hypothetical protein
MNDDGENDRSETFENANPDNDGSPLETLEGKLEADQDHGARVQYKFCMGNSS